MTAFTSVDAEHMDRWIQMSQGVTEKAGEFEKHFIPDGQHLTTSIFSGVTCCTWLTRLASLKARGGIPRVSQTCLQVHVSRQYLIAQNICVNKFLFFLFLGLQPNNKGTSLCEQKNFQNENNFLLLK